MARDHVLHRHLGEGGERPEAGADQDQQDLEPQKVETCGPPAQRRHRRDRDHEPEHGQRLVVGDPAQDLAGEAGADVERHHQHHQAQARIRGAEPDDGLQVARQEDVEPHDRSPAAGIGDEGAAHHRIEQNRDRDQRLRGRDQARHEQRAADERETEQREDGRRAPGKARARQIEAEHESDAGGHDQGGADHVEPVRALMARQPAQQRRGHRQGGEAEREIEPEDRRPMQMVGQESAQRRTAGASRGVGHGEIRIVAPALARRRHVAQHHHAHRGQPAAADALQAAAQDQHQHGWGERT